MKLDVGKGERKGCGSWLRSELLHYSKGCMICTLYLHSTLGSGWICKHCSAQLIILLCLYMFVRDLYLN